MDTSKELYAGHDLEMIRKAVEIQELWKPAMGDFHCCGCNACIKREAEVQVVDGPVMDVLNGRDFKNTESAYSSYAIEYGTHFVEAFSEEGNSVVWLIRQDQLQGMLINNIIEKSPVVGFYKGKEYIIINLFRGFIRKNTPVISADEQELKFKSLEQLWLAFVMKEKFNKTWNGKDWILEGNNG